jgi:PEP-CTERM motif
VGKLIAALGMAGVLLAPPAAAGAFFFSTGAPDGRIATASRPGTTTEIESADDFILSQGTLINHATFTGLLPTGAPLSTVDGLGVEIYRVFPFDSVTPPSGRVPTRTNSPSDNAFQTRDTGVAGQLTFSATLLNPSFTAANSVLNGINPIPNQTTGGEGSVTGEEVQFDVSFTSPFLLPADHYFFVPQVALSSGNFLWLSAPKPITGGSGPFVGDLQSWIRNTNLDPDWLRIGTDIVGGTTPPTFNATFSLDGQTVPSVPEPGTLGLLGLGIASLGFSRRRKAN